MEAGSVQQPSTEVSVQLKSRCQIQSGGKGRCCRATGPATVTIKCLLPSRVDGRAAGIEGSLSIQLESLDRFQLDHKDALHIGRVSSTFMMRGFRLNHDDWSTGPT